MSSFVEHNGTSDAEFQATPYRIEVTDCDGRGVVQISGAVDLGGAQTLLAAARTLAARPGDVAVDWSAARYIHSSSLQVLLALRATLAREGRAMDLTADSAEVRRFLQLAGLSEAFPLQEGPRP